MRSLFLVAAISALAWARPETYKETEDFQYSRSSSDEGSKSGHYAAQRGNVPGNYEQAHNMDGLAQHQMSTAVKQVEGELGDAAKTPIGSVYTAANSRGVYGSGHYDLSNLQGRNFGEGSGSSHSSMSSAYNQHAQNSDWRSQAQQAGYGASSQLAQSSLAAGSLHGDTSGHGASNLGGSHSSRGYHSASGYHSQSGYNSQNSYDQNQLSESSGSYGAQAGDQSRRYAVVTPVRIVGRPGAQIAIPVYAQASDSQRTSSLYDQSSSNRQTYAQQSAASRFDQNAINSEAEVLNNNQQDISSVPVSDGKHYSSSYNYHKGWERHSETTDFPVPVAPTVSPLPKHSELYDDALSNLQQTHSQNSHSGNAYNANSYNQAHSAHSASSRQSDYRTHADAQNSNAYTQGTYGTNSGLSPLVDSQPKSYQSSYAYHKSWEKQGDPYVIVPATDGEASQRLISGNTKNSASSQRYGSHQHYSQGGVVDCNSLCRYRRATRSARTEDYYQQNQEDLGQQAQTGWEENLSQQTQPQNRPEKLEDLGQHASSSGNFQNMGQQTQLLWGNIEQQQKPQKLQDFGQQTLQPWDTQPQKLEAFGQQTQQSWDNLHQERRPQNIEQTQPFWGNLQQQHPSSQKIEDLGQQTQGKWQLNQQSESTLEELGQQTQKSWDTSTIQQESSRQNLGDLGQQTQGKWETDIQQFQQTFENFDNLGQQTQSKWNNLESLGQQTQQSWNNLGNTEQQNKTQQSEDLGQQSQNKWDDLDNLGQQAQTQWYNINTVNKKPNTDTTNTEQQTQTHFESVDEMKLNREHAEDNTHYTFHQENVNINNPDHPAFWGVTDEQKHEGNHSYDNHNFYSNSQSHGTSWGHGVNNNNAQTTHNNPLQTLWDKLDNMEEQSEHSSTKDQQHTTYEISQNSYGQESTSHHESNWDRRNDSHHHETHNSGYQPPIVFKTFDKPNNDQIHNKATSENPKEEDLPEEPEPAEIGRGDIGAEGESATTQKAVPNSQTFTTYINPDKTPEEIEALSLSRGTEENANSHIGVLSTSQQKLLEEQRQKAANDSHQINSSISTTTTSTTTSRNTTPKSYVEESGKQSQDLNHSHNFFQQNTEQQSEDFGQQSQDLSQQNLHHFTNLGLHSHNIDQQNTGQQLEDFGQQSQDLSQQNLQQFSNLGQQSHSFDQQNTGQQLEDFGQQSQDSSQQNLQQFSNLEQHSHSFDQQNTGQQLEDFGQQSQDLNQQNLQQFTNLGQHSHNFDQQNTGQQLEDLGQQSQDLSKQNLQQFSNLGQHSHSFDQQNTGQQLEDFGQQSQDLNQQNPQQFTNLEQHSQNFNQETAGQQLEDLGQQSQDLNQQNLQSSWSQNLHRHQAREFVPNSNAQVIQEEIITPVNVHVSEDHPKQEVEITPPSVTSTEKPGFWKSVGSKLSTAKDSVASWFKRS